jgi:hypothetical protein
MNWPPRRCSKPVSLVVLGVCVSFCGCQDIRTVWSAEVRSPDGYWVATAQTIQHSGPGTAGLESSVFLKRDSSPRLLILGFLHRGDYQGNGISLTMHWASPTHLNVTYDGRAASLEFQTIRCDGVDISVRDIDQRQGASSSATSITPEKRCSRTVRFPRPVYENRTFQELGPEQLTTAVRTTTT